MSDRRQTAAANDGGIVDCPLVLEDPDAAAWDDVADVVVVGFGGAGACAALEARAQGADVLAVDRFEGGGATAFSGGVIYAGNTSIQREAGVVDDVEQMYRYLSLEVGTMVGSATVRRYCDDSSDNLEWLMRHGVPYQGSLFSEKTAYPPDGSYLYYSGNEQVSGYKEHATPAARGHRPVGKGMTGHVMFDALKKAAVAAGVRRLDHSPVSQLIIDKDGTVIGVVSTSLHEGATGAHQAQYKRVVPMLPFRNQTIESARSAAIRLERVHGRQRLIRARKGVILSTGGFVNNSDMMRRYAPALAKHSKSSLRMGSLGCDGSGIQLGRSVDGDTTALDRMLIARNLTPPAALVSGILVNKQGRRFINESSYSGFIGQHISDQEGGTAFLIIDAALMRAAIRQIFFGGWLLFKFSGPQLLNIFFGGTRKAKTLEELARKCDIDPAGLRQTVDRYNAATAGACDDELHKSNHYLQRLMRPPFYAVNESIWAPMAFTMVFSLGGLRINEETGEVLDTSGKVIRHLYAAGRAALGLCSNSYISGLSVGDCVFSGRRAGRHSASQSANPVAGN